MILAGLLWTGADLAVSGLVVTVQVPGRCWFNTTGFYETITTPPFNNTHVPPNVGNLYDLVTRAQSTSQVNGGIGGIYAKVNGDLTFRADPEDNVGYWKCQDFGQNETYSATDSDENVINDLVAKDLLFDNPYYISDQYPNDARHAHLVAWSASIDDDDPSLQPWDVRASIDMTPKNIDDKVMKTYLCVMNAAPVEWVLSHTPPSDTLSIWIPLVKARMFENTLFTPPAPDPAAVIESILEAMIMISGASISGPNIKTSPVTDPTQGCLAPKALVPWPVIFLLILVIIGLASMVIFWIYQTIIIRRKRKCAPWQGVPSKGFPNGLLSWMVQAVRETRVGQEVKNKHLSQWLLLPDQNSNTLLLSQGGTIWGTRNEVRPEDTTYPAAIPLVSLDGQYI